MKTICAVSVWVLLCELSRQDLEDRTIDGRFLLLPFFLGILLLASGGLRFSAGERIPALLPGLFLTCFSLVSGGAVGEGDGLLIWSLGYVLPSGGCFFLLAGSMLLAGLWGCARILLSPGEKRKRLRQERLPMVPPLTLVYALELLVYCMGGELF